MNATVARQCAAIACATMLCGPLAAQTIDNAAFAPGKEGVHPRVVSAVSRSIVADAAPDGAYYQGIWQNAPIGSEPGWAIAIAPRGDSIIATWFTYDADGSPMWLEATAYDLATLLDGYAPSTIFVGELYRAFATTGAPADVALVAYGPMAIEFEALNVAVLHYNLDGGWKRKTIERTSFADALSRCSSSPRFPGLWTIAADEYRGGLHIAHDGDVVVATWFTYDAQGKGVWRVMSATPRGPREYDGTLYQARGPAVTLPFDATKVAISAVGAGTLTFADDAHGVFSYAVDGVPAAIAIARQTLATPLPLCN